MLQKTKNLTFYFRTNTWCFLLLFNVFYEHISLAALWVYFKILIRSVLVTLTLLLSSSLIFHWKRKYVKIRKHQLNIRLGYDLQAIKQMFIETLIYTSNINSCSSNSQYWFCNTVDLFLNSMRRQKSQETRRTLRETYMDTSGKRN